LYAILCPLITLLPSSCVRTYIRVSVCILYTFCTIYGFVFKQNLADRILTCLLWQHLHVVLHCYFEDLRDVLVLCVCFSDEEFAVVILVLAKIGSGPPIMDVSN
jgi:hypothetical protein